MEAGMVLIIQLVDYGEDILNFGQPTS
jgi:hypothetical protein